MGYEARLFPLPLRDSLPRLGLCWPLNVRERFGEWDEPAAPSSASSSRARLRFDDLVLRMEESATASRLADLL